MQKLKTTLDEEMATVRETIHRAALKLSAHAQQKGQSGSPSVSSRNGSSEGSSSSITQDLTAVMERLHHLENERKVRRRMHC